MWVCRGSVCGCRGVCGVWGMKVVCGGGLCVLRRVWVVCIWGGGVCVGCEWEGCGCRGVMCGEVVCSWYV